MIWKVAQAWTSVNPQDGYRHFQVMLQGGKGQERWVELEAVLDSNVRLRVNWNELKNQELWTSGWQQLPPEE
jgi:tryptophan-rich hypothetical protein